jgi:peptide deformylase
MTPQGKQITKKVSGWNAVVIQHEIDHLDGILFIDKLL